MSLLHDRAVWRPSCCPRQRAQACRPLRVAGVVLVGLVLLSTSATAGQCPGVPLKDASSSSDTTLKDLAICYCEVIDECMPEDLREKGQDLKNNCYIRICNQACLKDHLKELCKKEFDRLGLTAAQREVEAFTKAMDYPNAGETFLSGCITIYAKYELGPPLYAARTEWDKKSLVFEEIVHSIQGNSRDFRIDFTHYDAHGASSDMLDAMGLYKEIDAKAKFLQWAIQQPGATTDAEAKAAIVHQLRELARYIDSLCDWIAAFDSAKPNVLKQSDRDKFENCKFVGTCTLIIVGATLGGTLHDWVRFSED